MSAGQTRSAARRVSACAGQTVSPDWLRPAAGGAGSPNRDAQGRCGAEGLPGAKRHRPGLSLLLTSPHTSAFFFFFNVFASLSSPAVGPRRVSGDSSGGKLPLPWASGLEKEQRPPLRSVPGKPLIGLLWSRAQ